MKIKNLSGLKTFLFDNKTTRQTIFKNSVWLGLAEIINKVLIFVLFIYVARILGATEYGKFNFAIAVMYLFSILPGFVSPEIVTRELSQDKDKEKEYSDILSLKVLLGLGGTALLIISSFFLTSDPVVRKVIWILALYNLFGAPIDILHAFFRARQRMEYESAIKILDAVLSVAFVFFVIFKFPSIVNLSYAYLAESFVLLVVVVIFFHFKIHRLSFSWDRKIWEKIFSLSWPMALVVLITTAYNQTDSVIMGYLGQMTENGWYNAALRITKLTLVPVALLSHSFFPVLSKFYREKENLQKIWDFQTKIMIILALPLVAGGVLTAPKIINLFYGQVYAPAALAFQILIFMVGIAFLYDTCRQALIITHQQKKLFWAVLAGAVVNVILNLILIPRFSLYGAAWSSVIANLIILFLLVGFVIKFTTVRPLNSDILLSFLVSGVASGLMYLAISWTVFAQLNVIFLILIAIVVYFGSLFVLRPFLKLNYAQIKI